jgi:hypothetical protein
MTQVSIPDGQFKEMPGARPGLSNKLARRRPISAEEAELFTDDLSGWPERIRYPLWPWVFGMNKM